MFLAETLALAAAACIALSSMLISELQGRVDIIRLARWQILAAFAMTGAASLALGGWRSMEGWQAGLLALSSLFGIIIASTTYFAAIYAAGPRVTALLFSLTSPFALALGYFWLGETISMRQGFGVALVLAGIALAIGVPRRLGGTGETSKAAAPPPLTPPHKGEGELPPAESGLPLQGASVSVSLPHAGRGRGGGNAAEYSNTSSRLWLGVGLGVVTALGQALGSLFARPAMAAGVEPFTAMAVRSGLAALFFLLLTLLPIAALHKPYRFRLSDFGLGIGSAFFGTGLGMSLLMAALTYGNVGIVSTLSSMTPVVILPMVWLRSGVAPSGRAWLGAALAVAGTALISLQG